MTVGNIDEFHGVILDSINDGVFTVDEEWRITSFNRGAERITGVKRKEALGRRCCEVFRASICEASCALRETLATGRPIVNKPIYILGVKGQRIPISISTAVFKDRRGKVIGGVETFRDLTLVEDLRKELERKHTFADIVGRSAAIRQVFELLPLLAESESTVLIHGASGTGKELFARAIHSLSRRKDHPFVAINCGALPDTLLESELFGYKAGAFTDARRDKPGRFELARGGTIFLDEIGDISPAMQARLLRVLQEKVFEPLGSVESVATDVRVLAATHQDLAGLVEAGTFREDLFYRIHVVRLELPRLCQRREDVPLLTDHFVAKFNRLQGKDVVGVADEVLSRLMEYEFPGNVRELENIIEHAFVLCRSGLIQMSHLPASLRRPAESCSLAEMTGMTLAAAEQWLIRDALSKHQGNRTAAAKQLGIDPSTLHRKIRSYGIEMPGSKPRKS
ncbi:MAG: sigma 54-interacting transcriptional regulator [Pirellulaceae bacterium]|nr:sigma 54-interacting transcriptional regulator [Pirellulaceae bacterium]